MDLDKTTQRLLTVTFVICPDYSTAKHKHVFMFFIVVCLVAASSIVRKRRLALFGHVARPANQILRTCCEAQDGVRQSPDWRRARGRPPTTWIHQICRDTGIPVTDALELAEDRSFWRQIATAGCYGWTLRIMMMMKHKRMHARTHTYILGFLQPDHFLELGLLHVTLFQLRLVLKSKPMGIVVENFYTPDAFAQTTAAKYWRMTVFLTVDIRGYF